jgi:hypothetical protein
VHFLDKRPSRADLLSWDLFVYAKDLLIEAMAGPKGQCELAHTAVAQLRVTLIVGNSRTHEGRNEKISGNNCPTLLVEYRPSS